MGSLKNDFAEPLDTRIKNEIPQELKNIVLYFYARVGPFAKVSRISMTNVVGGASCPGLPMVAVAKHSGSFYVSLRAGPANRTGKTICSK
jgi:hypothetical protein